ncbi:MAG TPA: xanthine dehydrogenase family protein molybdopterin-binding subunit [Pseudolabrys sp.]|nr:xanthine dehydrogenase family protein molybdopterin-binding subunit [Pseudolabrys sp.]
MSVPRNARANTLVGQPVERVEDRRFLLGRGQFADDYAPEGVLHAAIFRSSVAHARITGLDLAAALRLPGVHAILAAKDIGPNIPRIPLRLAPIPGFDKYLQPVIASDKVRYAGEPVAVVVADSRAIAEDALELIEFSVESLDAIPDWRSSATDRALLFEENGTNVPVRYTAEIGDTDKAFANADYTRFEFFRAHRHTAAPMETRGLIAEWDAVRAHLTVTAATKVNFINRRTLAAMLQLDEHDIDMIELDVGGGFGVRGEFYPEDFLIPFAARRVGRPVKWIEDRREHLLATNHSREIDCELEIACRRDGTILGMRGRIYGDMGAYIRTNGGVVPAKAAQFLHGPYRVKNLKVDVAAFMTSKTPVGTYRAPGRFEANFFRERLFDMAARDLDIDPIQFRRKNLITESELPYSIGQLVPYETPTEYDSGDYHAAFDRLLQEFGWEDKQQLQGKQVEGRYHGLAATCFVESGGAGPRENAKLTLERDGSVTIDVGSSALGQGLETVFAQIAADALSLSFEIFRVRHGSTTLVHEGFGTYHSRALVMGGSAVLDGCKNLLSAVRSAAAAQFGCPPEAIEFSEGLIRAPSSRTISFAQLAAAVGPLAADGTFANTKRTYSYGAHAAHVAVDIGTGHVEIIDYLAIEDVGRAVNPGIVHGQAIGAAVQGLGGVFLDQLVYDQDAQLLNASLADYLLPLATDFPNVRGVTLELRPSPTNPLGAKGAGEGGIVAVAATVGNAVAAALVKFGVEPKELPLSPAKIWSLVQSSARRQ